MSIKYGAQKQTDDYTLTAFCGYNEWQCLGHSDWCTPSSMQSAHRSDLDITHHHNTATTVYLTQQTAGC